MVPPLQKTTQDDPAGLGAGHLSHAAKAPGLVLIFSVDSPRCDVLPLQGGQIEIGRGEGEGVLAADSQISRLHARVRFDGRDWEVEDLGSRNGTSVDGERVTGRRSGADLKMVRVGASVFLVQADVEPFRAGVSRVDETLVGPTLARAWKAITRVARHGATLHITGDSGTGKEHAAKAFHQFGPRRDGPFIAVNCATIPGNLAEAMLFGARKGAFTGATTDTDGYVQAAHKGVLFLDEVAELDLAVQAKLLRALEVREVTPLGAVRPVKVDFALVSATHKDLRAQITAGKLREDLFFRLSQRGVVLPPLRERPEEIPWHVAEVLRREASEASAHGERASPLKAHASLIEACVLRAWPGNVREFRAEIEATAQEARSEASPWVQASHLLPSAGQALVSPSSSLPPPPPPPPPAPARRTSSLPADEEIEEALRREGGNVARTARALGMHRTQLSRWIARRKGK